MIERINTDKISLRTFGITMGFALLVITSVIFLKRGYLYHPVLAISSVFFLTGILSPGVLKPVYIFWMRLALILSWINTRVLLIIIYYLAFTPISIFLKLLRKDLLDIKIDNSARSYWKKKTEDDFKLSDYERQF